MITKKLLLISSLFLLSISILSSEDSGEPTALTLESYIGTYKVNGYLETFDVLGDDLVILEDSTPDGIVFFRCDRSATRCTVDLTRDNAERTCESLNIELLKSGSILMNNPCLQKSFYYKRKRKEQKTCS